MCCKLYHNSKKVYCNCPDSKKWCKHHNVVCKHICFLLIKVFKLTDLDYFYNNLILSDDNIIDLLKEYDNICFTNNKYINDSYLEKYKLLKKKNLNTIIIKENQNEDCCICFEKIIEKNNIKLNLQCKICLNIIHKSCINKWLSIGNNTCPYCRSTLEKNDNFYKNLL